MGEHYGAYYGAVMARKTAPGMVCAIKGRSEAFAPSLWRTHPNPEAVMARAYGAYGARGPQHISTIVQRILARAGITGPKVAP